MKKRGALELSIGTIVIIVIAMTMLILGIVFVRTIMCGAIGMTGDINNQVRAEINKLFGATAGEVVCIGSGGEAVSMLPGKTNIVYCAVKAPETASYTINTKTITKAAENWIEGEDSWSGNVAPGDENPKKVLRLRIPENAAEQLVTITLEIKREGQLISTQDLDFEVRRVGLIKSAVC